MAHLNAIYVCDCPFAAFLPAVSKTLVEEGVMVQAFQLFVLLQARAIMSFKRFCILV